MHPEYTPRSMKVIDDLVEEHIETPDAILMDRNDRYWAAKNEVTVQDGLVLEVTKLKNMVHICVAVIWVLVAIIVLPWIGQVYVITATPNMCV